MKTESIWHQEKGYEFSGLFYTAEDKCSYRRILNIRKIGCVVSTPDLMVVMMNPGGSKTVPQRRQYPPLNAQTFFPTSPDNTQWRVIKFMECNEFKYARVINLTDVRNKKSGGLKKEKCEKQSIFNDYEQVRKYFKRGVPILLAWGAKEILHNLADEALQFISQSNSCVSRIFGAPGSGDYRIYYHPLCRKPGGWLNLVTEISLDELVENLNQNSLAKGH